ncbi:MAG: hypothetical protein FJ135_02510 [Deltaproteobacteria bacterium]|nr:hypothetical protein [Deltaproteobacteria bacterium]
MEVQIDSFHRYRNNTLQGFFNVYFPDSGMVIRGFSLHKNDKSKWIEIPAKPPTNPESNAPWTKILFFYDKREEIKFLSTLMKALDEYLGKQPDISFD